MHDVPVLSHGKREYAQNSHALVLTASLALFSATFWSSTEVKLRPAAPPSPAETGIVARTVNGVGGAGGIPSSLSADSRRWERVCTKKQIHVFCARETRGGSVYLRLTRWCYRTFPYFGERASFVILSGIRSITPGQVGHVSRTDDYQTRGTICRVKMYSRQRVQTACWRLPRARRLASPARVPGTPCRLVPAEARTSFVACSTSHITSKPQNTLKFIAISRIVVCFPPSRTQDLQ